MEALALDKYPIYGNFSFKANVSISLKNSQAHCPMGREGSTSSFYFMLRIEYKKGIIQDVHYLGG